MDYLQLVNERLREENTACVNEGDFMSEFLELWVCMAEIFDENSLDELFDDDSVLLAAATKVAWVGELVESRGLVPAAALPLPLVQEELVSPGLGLSSHHILHPLHCHRRTETRK